MSETNMSPTQILVSQVPDLIAVHKPQEVVPPHGLTTEHQQLYDNMVRYMKLKIQRPFTAPKIVMLIASGIKFLGKVKTLSGSEKKDLVLHALRETIQRSSYIRDFEKAEIIALIDTFGDSLIDNLVEFAENAYTFMKNKTSGWCIRKNVSSRALVLDQNNIDELKQYLKLKFQRPMTAPKIVSLVACGVKFIEQYRDLSGAEKKDIVIHALRVVIQECDFLSDEDKAMLIGYVDIFADVTIDYLVEFGKKLYLKAKKGCCT
jgi:hypothetical protein